MLKKGLSLFLCLLTVFTGGFFASAQDTAQDDPDGGYFTITVSDAAENESASGLLSVFRRVFDLLHELIFLFGGTKTTAKMKVVNYYDRNGTLLWSVALRAEFEYSKTKAVCTKAETECAMLDADWRLASATAGKNGATATANFTVRQKKLGVPLKTIEKTVTLTCDTRGNAV